MAPYFLSWLHTILLEPQKAIITTLLPVGSPQGKARYMSEIDWIPRVKQLINDCLSIDFSTYYVLFLLVPPIKMAPTSGTALSILLVPLVQSCF